jgi:hypothetical protein
VWGRVLKGNENGDKSLGGKRRRLRGVELRYGDDKEKERHRSNVMGYSKRVYNQ